MPRGGRRKGAGKKPGTKHKKSLEWESFGRILLSEGVAKAKDELMKLNGDKYLHHFERFVSYFQVKQPQTFGVDVTGTLDHVDFNVTKEELQEFVEKFKQFKKRQADGGTTAE